MRLSALVWCSAPLHGCIVSMKAWGVVVGDFGNLPWRGANFICLEVALNANISSDNHNTEQGCSCWGSC